MRISRTGSTAKSAGARTSRGDGTGFAPIAPSTNSSPAGQVQSNTPTSGSGAIGAVSAVMALQGVNSDAENRARALRKGRRLLDALERLRLSQLDQVVNESHLQNLRRAMEERLEESGDNGLDDAIKHIEVRAAVEIAKLEQRKLSR